GPVLPRGIVPQVDVVARAVQGHPVGAKTCNAVMLRRFEKGIAAAVVGDHCAEILYTKVVRPGNWDIWTLDHILPVRIVKIAVPHASSPLFVLPVFKTPSIAPAGAGTKWPGFFQWPPGPARDPPGPRR